MGAAAGDVGGFLRAEDAVAQLLGQSGQQLAQRDHAFLRQPPAEQHERRALDQGVVDIEKRCRLGVLRHVGVRLGDPRRAGGGECAANGVDPKGELVDAEPKRFFNGGGSCGFAGGAL